eukprot:CAMPEP_0198203474 /NCGR_PEP_ID=MMETSP1445-20131203/6766_1 /TAXON_ID=36898 /ORGANISM="Pyramimonas sp., Strain CCMP2087" /LENGTH=296 /DNA_ID=CAMNT_0043874893 /DNA_START=531 /DNA_END=1421 /DNA_ORIENTATION=-
MTSCFSRRGNFSSVAVSEPEEEPVEKIPSVEENEVENGNAAEEANSENNEKLTKGVPWVVPWVVPWDGGMTALVTSKYLVLWFILGILGVSIVAQLRGDASEMPAQDKALAVLALQSLESLAVVSLLRSSLKSYSPLPEPWFKYNWADGRAVLVGLGGAVGAVVCVGAASAINQLIGNVGEAVASAPVSELVQNGGLTAFALSTSSIVIAPALEEFFWRGFFLPSLTRSMAPLTAVAVSGIVFALVHCQPHDFLPLAALGGVLGLVALKADGNLVAPTITHVGYNAVVLLAISGEH